MKEETKQQLIEEAKMEQKLKSRIENEVQRNLNYARKIQLSLLPRFLPKTREYEFASYYSPIEAVGGDIYDVQYVNNNNYIVFYIGDVAGHGIPAALLTIFVKQSLEMFSYYQNKKIVNSPSEVIKKLNKKLIEAKFEGHPQATLFYCVYDINSKMLTYTSTGHPPAVYINNKNEIQFIGQPCLPIGWEPEIKLYEKQIELKNSEKILLYTDGLFEDLKKFTQYKEGFDVIYNIIEKHKTLPIAKLINKIINEREEIKSNTQEDDIAILGFEIKEA